MVRHLAVPKSMVRHKAFVVAIVAGIIAFAAGLLVRPGLATGIGADVFFAVYLGLIVLHWHKFTAEHFRKTAAEDDAPATAIFAATVVVVAAAMASLFLALNGGPAVGPWPILVGAAAVVLGWFAVHTLAALHYGYEYYEAPPGGETGEVSGGLDFPGRHAPDGLAFLYFSYVIGMTAQVSDVEVTSPKMRRLVTVHALFSFWFNTVLLAATVNAAIAIAGGR